MRSLGGDEFIGHLLKGLPFGPTGILIFILLVAFIAGFFLDWLEIVLIILPLVAPVVKDLGFNLVWFVVVFAVCLQTSFLTPPVGFSLFYLKGVVPERDHHRAHLYRHHPVRDPATDYGGYRIHLAGTGSLAAAQGIWLGWVKRILPSRCRFLSSARA